MNSIKPPYGNVRMLNGQGVVANGANPQAVTVVTPVEVAAFGRIVFGWAIRVAGLPAADLWAGQLGLLYLQVNIGGNTDPIWPASTIGQDSEEGAGGNLLYPGNGFRPVSIDMGWFKMLPVAALQMVVLNRTGVDQAYAYSLEIDQPLGPEEVEFPKYPGSVERGLECLVSSFEWD